MKLTSLLLLVGIVLLGGLLRFYNISSNPPGLYMDEVSIGVNAYDILTTGKDQYGIPYPLGFQAGGEYKLPLYIYLVSLSMAFFGHTEFAIRFPSALFGTLTIPVIFLLLKELLSREKKQKHILSFSLLGTALFAITPWHIHFSRGGFEATVALFLYAFGLWSILVYARTLQRRYLIGAIIPWVLSAYTYNFYRIFAFLSFIVVLGISVWKKIRVREITIGAGVALLLLLPIILFSFTAAGQLRFLQTSAFVENPIWYDFLWPVGNISIFIHNYLSFFSITYLFHFGDQINRHQMQDFGLLYLWQLPFIILGMYTLIQTKNWQLKLVVLFLLLVGPLIIAITRPSPHSLRFLIATIPYTVLTIWGFKFFYEQKIRFKKLVLVGICFLAVWQFALYLDAYFIRYPKMALLDWGGVCKELAFSVAKYSSYDHIMIDNRLQCQAEYFTFYAPNIKLTYIEAGSSIPKQWKDDSVLFIRPYYKKATQGKLIDTVYLPDRAKSIFAQFYQL